MMKIKIKMMKINGLIIGLLMLALPGTINKLKNRK
jgi:hypothetical protein